MMEFRWIAAIALWTLLSGPALYTPNTPVGTSSEQEEVLSANGDENSSDVTEVTEDE